MTTHTDDCLCRDCDPHDHRLWERVHSRRPSIRFAKLHPAATIPTRATPGSVGLDLYLLRPSRCPLFISPRVRAIARTGLQVIIPPGYEGQVRPRSGLAKSRGVTVLNAPGTIDADFRGELEASPSS